MKYAVNVADFFAQDDQFHAKFLIAAVIPNQLQVDCEPGRMDGIGVLLECDEKRAAAITEVVRQRYSKNECRIYTSKTGKSWKRV